uniref:Uncharacterized protein n=1 Tax=viral metagenome TaxID=1070528 RepID=A0A6C0H2I3_9ZZZZ
MSAGSVSLESALRTCKVDTAWASRVESDRFFNPNHMVCPIWNGMDTTGRSVCQDSFYTKRGGCNSATDRVDVENNVSRPQYMEYLTLSANGIAGNIYGSNEHSHESINRRAQLDGVNNITGNFGLQYGSTIQSRCGYDAYNKHDNHHNHTRGGVYNSSVHSHPKGGVYNSSVHSHPKGGVYNSSVHSHQKGGVYNSSDHAHTHQNGRQTHAGGVYNSSAYTRSQSGF